MTHKNRDHNFSPTQRLRPRTTARMERPRRREFETLDVNFLEAYGFTEGFIEAIIKNRTVVQLVFWILDNSASMRTYDGNLMTHGSGKVRVLKCTRWEELQETALFHVELAASIGSPTTFRLLNHPGHDTGEQIFSVATTPEVPTVEHDVSMAKSTLQQVKPKGNTPLTEHIQAIISIIEPLNDTLKGGGKKVSIVIATDGLPTNIYGEATKHAKDSFLAEIQTLRRLEVILTVRLCTDEKIVVDFWNKSDAVDEVQLDVLDDYESEAKEVYNKNPWLTYGLPLHRLREMGFEAKVVDELDEIPLSLTSLCEFLRILFGNVALPDPKLDWRNFCHQLEEYLLQERVQYNPIHKKMMPWIDMKILRKLYQPRGWIRF